MILAKYSGDVPRKHRRPFRSGFLAVLLGALCPTPAQAAEFWTVKSEGGVLVTNTGTAALNIGSYQPTGPNPAGTTWVPCNGNYIYFHKKADGSVVDPVLIERMLATALSAFKSSSRIRVSIERDSSGNCYTNQIYDLGS